MPLELEKLRAKLQSLDTAPLRGKLLSVVGLSVRARLPGARIGDAAILTCKSGTTLRALIVGVEKDDAILMPLGSTEGLSADDEVVSEQKPFSIEVGEHLRGSVLDGLGHALLGTRSPGVTWSVQRQPPPALSRTRISRPLITGIRTIDALMTLGEGQRVGLFAGSGVGKSTLLGQIAKQTDADVFVACLIGERGREVNDFLEDSLGKDGLAKGVLVCATSDTAPVVRMMSAHVATAIAEYFRDQGKRVLLLMDSVTRFARAAREVGLAAGEPPVRRGYPPSVFAELPRLLERTGMSDKGSITAIYTVLVEGSDMEEPIADEVRGILDGHIILDRKLAGRGRFPAIDVLSSLSRVMPQVTAETHREGARALRELISAYEQQRDFILLGAYKKGSDRTVDRALELWPRIETFLAQRTSENMPFAETLSELAKLR